MFKTTTLAASAALLTLLSATSTLAASDADIEALRAEINGIKETYEDRIAELEAKLANVQNSQGLGTALAPNAPATAARRVLDNSFNPAIGVVFNGRYQGFSSSEGDVAGFAVGEEGERGSEGFSVDHTELNFSANVDDKFAGSTTIAIAEHGGETEIELEEAFVETLPGFGLPDGLSVKAGRAFWTLGYLNEHHEHADDFADRPLPYRVFFDGAFNDDGAEASYILPTDIYAEVGAGIFTGSDYIFNGSRDEGLNAYSAFARIGDDIGDNHSWRLGAYYLGGEASGRESNEDTVEFNGDTDIYAADFRYTFAPTGNAREQELILQGEYFWREEDGTYEENNAGAVAYDEASSGWYAQAVFKFDPQWRIGARYSQLIAGDTPAGLVGTALDSEGHDPEAYSVMLDWTNSEFSRVRTQYNYEELANGQDDNQFIVQYIMSLGAHGAHKY